MLIALLCCSPPSVGPITQTDDSTVDSTPPDDSQPVDSEDTGDSYQPGDPLPYPDFEYDCDDLPSEPVGDKIFDGARAYHGMAFDDDGSGSFDSLLSWTSGGTGNLGRPGEPRETVRRHVWGTPGALGNPGSVCPPGF